MSVQIAIVCTRCGCTGEADEGAGREPAHSLRAKLKGRGWAVGCYSMKDRASTGVYDFCPPCVQNYVRLPYSPYPLQIQTAVPSRCVRAVIAPERGRK